MKIRSTLLPYDIVESVNGDILLRITYFRFSQLSRLLMAYRREGRLTRWDVVVRFEGDVVVELYEVDGLQNG
jgi:hypothetical protein